MMTYLRKRMSAGSAGQTGAEFAIVATVLFLLMFGLMTLGTAVYYYNTISNAAREAVRYAVVHSSSSAAPATNSQIQQVALDYAQGVALTTSNVVVTWPADPNKGMRSDAQVKISYTYNLNIPFMSPVALNLTSTSRMLVSQ